MKVRWSTCDHQAERIYLAVLQEDSMTVADVKKNTEQKMQKSIDTLKADLAKVRTGRAHAGILDHVQVDYYGTPTHISQVANITLIDARTIGVQPWEKKMIATVEKAIRESDLGLNPSTQGDLIRVPTPALTEERRKEMVKLCKSEAEDAKIAVRNIRRDANEALKKLLKDKAISEDDERRAQDDVQKLTDKFGAEIDKLVAEKEKEVLTV
jgi:ribosome recycling factor